MARQQLGMKDFAKKCALSRLEPSCGCRPNEEKGRVAVMVVFVRAGCEPDNVYDCCQQRPGRDHRHQVRADAGSKKKIRLAARWKITR